MSKVISGIFILILVLVGGYFIDDGYKAKVDRLLHTATETRVKVRAEFTIGESIKVISGPLSDFSGEIAEIYAEQGRVKVLVSIFGRETPAELSFDQVKKLT